jgi:hypothetical protein
MLRQNGRLIRFPAKNESASAPRNSTGCVAIDEVRRWTIGLRAEEEIRREAEEQAVERSRRRLFPGQRFSRALRRSAAK